MSVMNDLEDRNEEFNNFMYRVNEISNIVHKLASKDKNLQEMGTTEAEQYLNDSKNAIYENICEDTVQLTVKSDRTLINKKALMAEDKDQNTMSQEAFMEQVSKDADRRYKDKLARQERADTFKTRATKAFRRGEYEKALSLYNKAIEQIKDSCMLYINRALTQINLQRYPEAVKDAETALQLNENSLKAGLLLVKSHFLNNNISKFKEAIENVKANNEHQIEFINEYVEELQSKKNSQIISISS